MTERLELFIEIGTEEIPAGEVEPALEFLTKGLIDGLAELRLSHGGVQSEATPRRLTVTIADVEAAQADLDKDVAGPPASVGFRDGEWTKAAIGFAKGLGLSVEDLVKKETPKGEYLHAVVHEAGKPARSLLPALIETTLSKIPFKRTMRWGHETQTFIRPIQWMVGLLGGEVLGFRYADVEAGRQSRGHRFLAPEPFAVENAAQYRAELEKRHVVLSKAERARQIAEGARALAAQAGGRLREDPELVDEVAQLVEKPVPMLAAFDERYLAIPDQVLISEMREHQRYLSIIDAEGKLLPRFVVIGNMLVTDESVVLDGYRRVITARFEDGAFFYAEDQKKSLFDHLDRLRNVQFHRALGKTYEKVERIAKLSFWIARALGEPSVEQTDDLRALAESDGDSFSRRLARSAYLAKADLTTRMIFEFPELQGTMGRAYAENAHEPKGIAQAIEEHYLPRNAKDVTPQGTLGAIVGLADRLDTIAGIFSVQKGPTGAADPFGLRRAAIGMIQILRAKDWHLPLHDAIGEAVRLLEDKRKKKSEADVISEVGEFFRGRLKGLVTAEGIAADSAEAALAAGYDDVVDASERARALARLREGSEFGAVANAFKRVANILKKADDAGQVDPSAFVDDKERALFSASEAARAKLGALITDRKFDDAFSVFVELRPALGQFFGGKDEGDGVLVMHDDAAIKANRIALVASIQELFSPLADFTKLS